MTSPSHGTPLATSSPHDDPARSEAAVRAVPSSNAAPTGAGKTKTCDEIVRKAIRGHEFWVGDPRSYPYSQNIFDDPEPLLARWTFEPGQVAIDVGASFGVYTLLALAQSALCMAFEPSTDGYPVLVRNVALNGWGERATIIRGALGDGEPPPEAWAAEVWGQHYPAQDVRWARLDEWPGLRVDKLKVDVEGVEWHVLRGAYETLKRERPVVLVEVHDGCNAGSQIGLYPESIGSAGKIEEMLKFLNYEVEHEQGARRYLIGTPMEKVR